jgi:YhcH/YjgK/YiaL family protein
MITGRERMGVAPIEGMRSQMAYDGEKDLEFFAGGASEGQLVTVDQGSFTIFLPHDVHMPNLALAASQRVKKVVVKVKLD